MIDLRACCQLGNILSIALVYITLLSGCTKAYLPHDFFLNDARLGRTNSVIAKIEGGADVNFRGEHQETALMYAASRHHLDTVRALLARGADVNAQDENGFTVLMTALNSPDGSPVAHELLNHGAEVNLVSRESYTALILAVDSDMSDVAKRLISLGADVDAKMADGTSVLQLAERKGDDELIRLLKKAGVIKRK